MTINISLIQILLICSCLGQTIEEQKKTLENRGYGENHPVFKMLEDGKDISKYLNHIKPLPPEKSNTKPIVFYYAYVTKKTENDRYTPVVFDLREETLTLLLKSKMLKDVFNIEFISDSKVVIKIKPINSVKLLKIIHKNGRLNYSLLSEHEMNLKKLRTKSKK